MKKACMFMLFSIAVCGILSANNPDKGKGAGVPGTDNSKDNSKTVTPPSKPASQTGVKPKQPVKETPSSETYEMKGPSVFTFTVLSTYFNLPIRKK